MSVTNIYLHECFIFKLHNNYICNIYNDSSKSSKCAMLFVDINNIKLHATITIILVALLCMRSSVSISFLRYGIHACIHYSKLGLTIALFRGIISLLSL